MPELIIATTNPAKVEQIRGALRSLDLVVSGLDKNISLPVVEDGATAEANAHQKAVTYAQFFGQGVLSMDNALYLEGLPPDKQPGIHVRRCGSNNDRCSDEEMIRYYSGLIASLGERINGHWVHALCFATPAGDIRETTFITKRIFVSQPSQRITPGYPIESIQIDPDSGRYISEMTSEEHDTFHQKVIGAPLVDFVKTLPLEKIIN